MTEEQRNAMLDRMNSLVSEMGELLVLADAYRVLSMACDAYSIRIAMIIDQFNILAKQFDQYAKQLSSI